MGNWLTRVFQATLAAGAAAASNLAYALTFGLWGYLHSVFRLVSDGWIGLNRAFNANSQAHQSFIGSVVHGIITSWNWIIHPGATMWHYISHPPDLVDLIWNAIILKLESTAVATARLLGKFFLALLLHHLRTVLAVFEDVISAVL